ncbi:MAG: DUF378 domain-containing protein [Candidatus Paceibacterota bacterium]|nr:MAG: DUF378 domain-containing protein [Candidatus Paceibacterota bacterium]
MKNSALNWIVWILLVVGGLNWGLVGLGSFMGGNWNVVNWIFGSWPLVEGLVYVLVGLAAVLFVFSGRCRTCMPKGSQGGSAPMA